MKSARPKFETRIIRIASPAQVSQILSFVPHLPVDDKRPIEAVFREMQKKRGLDQNALMWAGPLADMAGQCWLDGRQHSAEVWNEYFKREFLPEVYDPEQCLEHYAKWEYGPTGERYLVGSSKDLTVYGMSIYITQIHAFGGNLGVMFSAPPQR